MDDDTRPTDPDAPVAPTAGEAPAPAQPAYAMPLPPGYSAYAAQQRPRFVDQVLRMRAVVAVALACLVIGGLSGFILGHAAGGDDSRFGRFDGGNRGPGFFQQGGQP